MNLHWMVLLIAVTRNGPAPVQVSSLTLEEIESQSVSLVEQGKIEEAAALTRQALEMRLKARW